MADEPHNHARFVNAHDTKIQRRLFIPTFKSPPPPLLIQNFKSTLTTLREQKGMYEVDNASTTQFHRRHIKLDGTISPRDGAQGKEEA